MFMHNFIKLFKKFQEFHCFTEFEPRQRLDLSQMTFDNLLGYILSISIVYAKFHHNSPLSSAIFTSSEFGARHGFDRR